MGEFLRRNLFIVVGVSLPLALIALILAVQAAHRAGVQPPETPVLYFYRASLYLRQHLEVGIEEGELRMVFRQPASDPAARQLAAQPFELAIHDPSKNRTQHHQIELPAFVDSTEAQRIAVPIPDSLAQLRLAATPVSPDGFRFESRSRSRGGLLSGLFGYRRGYGMDYELVRDGIGFDVPGQGGYGLHDAFIGWVIEP